MTTAERKSDEAIRQFIKALGRHKDADWTVKSDPVYWFNRIKDSGGIKTKQQREYWQMRCKREGSPSVAAYGQPVTFPVSRLTPIRKHGIACPSCGYVLGELEQRS